MRAHARILGLSLVAGWLVLGCVPDVDLSGRRCPCAGDWRCDAARDVCVAPPLGPAVDGGAEPADLARCEEGAVRDRSCYRSYPASVAYEDGRALCALWSGDVVQMGDAEEQAWVRATIPVEDDFWVGLTDEAREGQFRDPSGRPARYLNWDEGEPNGGANHDCVRFHLETGRWRDTRCRDAHVVICERRFEADD